MNIVKFIHRMNDLYGTETVPKRFDTTQWLRPGFRGAGLVDHGPEGVRQGYAENLNVKRRQESLDAYYKKYGKKELDKFAKRDYGKSFNKLDKVDLKNFKARVDKWGIENYPTEAKARSLGWEPRTLKEQGIQINLLEETNKKGKFDAAKFAKANNISMKALQEQAELLQGHIYDKRMLVSGKDMGRLKLEWIPEDATISDNALIKLHKSGLITYERTKIDELFYDAFGRDKIKGTNIDNLAFNKKKYLAIKDNLNEYRQLKDAINAKYPSINFQLDHPLSKSTLNKIFNASADELTRVNVLDAELNNNFKKSLSSKYENAVSSKNFRAKKAVESIAKDLNLNIGKVSKNLTGYDYGVKEFQKLNIKDEIIKSLKNQRDLSLNFKNYIKNNPELLKIAGYSDPSKIGTKLTKVTDKHIQGVAKILDNFWCGTRKAEGGRIGFKAGSGCPVEVRQRNFLTLTDDVAKGRVTGEAAEQIAKNAGKVVGKAGSKSALAAIFGIGGIGLDLAYEVGSVGTDMAMNNVSFKEAMQNNWLTGAFIKGTGQEEYHKGLFAKDSSAKPFGTAMDLLTRIEEEENILNKMRQGSGRVTTSEEMLNAQKDKIADLYSFFNKLARKEGGRYLALEQGSPEQVAYERAKLEYDSGREATAAVKRTSKAGFEQMLKEGVQKRPYNKYGYEAPEKYGEFTKNQLDELLKQFGSYGPHVSPQTFGFKDYSDLSTFVSNYGKTWDVAQAGGVSKMAGGGLTRTVAPDSGPMSQGLRSLYIDDMD